MRRLANSSRALRVIAAQSIPPHPARLAADKYVLRDREVGKNGRVLMNNGDALAPGVGAAEDRRLDAVLQNPAAVRLMDPAKDLDERALPCPILTGQRMHPPGMKPEIDVAQNLDGPEAFGDPAKFDDRGHRTPSGIDFVQLARPARLPWALLMAPVSRRIDTGAATPQLHPPRPP